MIMSTPPQTLFLRRLGFEANPFQFTNADEEPRLNEYFVAPPYFSSVYGDPRHAASCMVFAPRGAGKTAQRKMVEVLLPEDEVLCVTYDNFRHPRKRRLANMTLNDHLTNIARFATVGLLVWIGERRERIELLDAADRRALRLVALSALSNLTRAELEDAIHSLRNLSEKARDLWNEHHWALNAVLSSINIAFGGGGGVLVPADVDEPTDEDPEVQFDIIGRVAAKVGLQALYVLIDRVDETRETAAHPTAAYQMIAPLMHELRILEAPHFGFKFFLPDYLLPLYHKGGGRSDRIKAFQAQWTNEELQNMLSQRLKAYSQNRVDGIGGLLATDKMNAPQAERLALWFAQRSPRDLIRIWGRAVDEQLRMDDSVNGVSFYAFVAGLDSFCVERAREVAGIDGLRDLQRVARMDFTVTEVASDVFHVGVNTARARIQSWMDRGVVKQIGEIPAAHGRPHRHYGVVDVRVARAMLPDWGLLQFLPAKARVCAVCEAWVLRDFDSAYPSRHGETCVDCGVPLVPPS